MKHNLALLTATIMFGLSGLAAAQESSIQEKTESDAYEIFSELCDSRWAAEWDYRKAQAELSHYSLSEPPPKLAARFQSVAKRVRRLDSRLNSNHIQWGYPLPDFKSAKQPLAKASASAAFPMAESELRRIRQSKAISLTAKLPSTLPSLHSNQVNLSDG